MRRPGWPGQGTRWLTEARFQLAPAGRQRHRWILLAVAALAVAAVVATPAGDLFGTMRSLAAARERESLLAAEVERLETRLAVEAATRRELEQQAADLNDRLAELTAQVEFLRSRGNGNR